MQVPRLYVFDYWVPGDHLYVHHVQKLSAPLLLGRVVVAGKHHIGPQMEEEGETAIYFVLAVKVLDMAKQRYPQG